MEHNDENQETPCFLPVIARLDNQETPCFLPITARLDRLDRLLLEKHSFSKSGVCAVESKNECNTLSSALEEVHHKGTLMERLALLEKRVLELSLEIDEGNTTSRSSSSAVHGSEMIGKNEHGDTMNKQQMEHPSTIQAQEKASPTDSSERDNSFTQKQKTENKITEEVVMAVQTHMLTIYVLKLNEIIHTL